jgi:hydrogenase expression/formation protein HypD
MINLKNFKNKDIFFKLVDNINNLSVDKKNIMEVCGGHTHAIQQFGLNKLLENKVNFLSGPGCPVCVTPLSYIDKAIELSENPNNIILTFGDIIRVPGKKKSLETAKSDGANVKMFYSPLDALSLIKDNSNNQIIFLAIGFETTIPITTQLLEFCDKNQISNFKILLGHKTIIEAMELLLISEKSKIDAYLCPGHVSSIIGSNAFLNIATDYKTPCVISGFEPLDILLSVYTILKQFETNDIKVENVYKRGVKSEGNRLAQTGIKKFFDKADAYWRGIGLINNSGFVLKKKYKKFAIDYDYKKSEKENKGCLCGLVLQGIKKPIDCSMFAKKCTPANPLGACMVSSEGACGAYYKNY